MTSPDRPHLPAAVPVGDIDRSALRQRMTGLSATTFHPDLQDLYRDLLDQAWRESEDIPGFGTLQEMALEMATYLWCEHKHYATMDEAIPALVYEKLVSRFTQQLKVIFTARNDASAEDQFKRQFASAVMQAVSGALSEHLAPEQVVEIQQSVVERLREASSAMSRR